MTMITKVDIENSDYFKEFCLKFQPKDYRASKVFKSRLIIILLDLFNAGYNECLDFMQNGEAAKVLGSRGGIKGGPSRANKLSPERRKEIARRAANIRWKGIGSNDIQL